MDYRMSDRGANLKAHKALPRTHLTPSNYAEARHHRRRISDEASSWVRSTSPTLTHPNPHLPLTPPRLPQDTLEKGREESDTPEVLEDVRLAENATPVGMSSPLTPDLTPPRTRAHDASLMEPSYSRYASSTSAADSFKTAREFATSVDSLYRLSSPDSDSSTVIQIENKWGNHNLDEDISLSTHARNIGLGLGLNLEHDSSPIVMPVASQSHEVDLADVLDDPLVSRQTAAAQMARKAGEELQNVVLEDELKSDLLPERNDRFSTTREGSLLIRKRIVSDRLQSHRKSLQDGSSLDQILPEVDELAPTLHLDSPETDAPNAASIDDQDNTETSNKALAGDNEDTSSPLETPVTVVNQQNLERMADVETPTVQRDGANLLDSDIRRLSHISAASSNVIEALVITPPRPKRQKLRRSSKNHCLRDASTSLNNSNRSSLNSNNQAQVLRHKPATLGEKVNRVSINSDSGISMGYDAFNSAKDNTIPLSEVPQRQSSLRGRKKLAPILTDKDKRNSRPVTAPERLMSPTGEIMSQMYPIFDTWPHSLRRSSGSRGREVRYAPPIPIPPRSSSLSAPTSRNTSRHDSLTSEARKAQDPQVVSVNHHRSSSPRVRISLPKPETPTTPHETERHVESFRTDEGEGSSAASPYLRSSLTRTPFSAISTPGLVEYGQGTTVSIYPHNNESVLMVQHSIRPEPQDATVIQQEPQIASQPSTNQQEVAQAQKSAVTELMSQEMRRNISATSTTRSVDSTYRPVPTSKTFNIARFPSSRRHSDSYITPLSRLATVTKNTPARRRIKIDDPSNTLSQFWRPNGFWNDLSDSEDEPDTPPTDATPRETLVVRNTLGLPQRSVVAGPVSLVKRLGSLRRRKQVQELQQTSRRHSSLPNLGSNYSLTTHITATTPLNKRQHNFSLSSLTHLHDTISQKRLERSEAQKERKRQKLKKSIGRVTLQDRAYAF